jgi:hypothetical protein
MDNCSPKTKLDRWEWNLILWDGRVFWHGLPDYDANGRELETSVYVRVAPMSRETE